MRFRRAPSHLLGAKLFSRRDVNARLGIERSLDRGDFLARLWALYGRPQPRQGGFEYYVRDSETNLDFIAYAGRKGPCYGGEIEQRLVLRRAVEAFEELLDSTPPVNCSIEYSPETEFGTGIWILGCRDGRSFDVPDRRQGRGPSIERRALR
ncbi:MAG TPA: hypothetical protein VLB44_00820 [Kofleriaceae bacterium]|nr:hypothetical protein [Kofleriaceae bacterium]